MEEEFQLGFLVRGPISFSVLYRHEPWQLSYPCWLTCTLLHHTTTPIHLSHLSLPHGSLYPEDTLSEKVFLVSLCSKQCCIVVTNVTVVLPRPFAVGSCQVCQGSHKLNWEETVCFGRNTEHVCFPHPLEVEANQK